MSKEMAIIVEESLKVFENHLTIDYTDGVLLLLARYNDYTSINTNTSYTAVIRNQQRGYCWVL